MWNFHSFNIGHIHHEWEYSVPVSQVENSRIFSQWKTPIMGLGQIQSIHEVEKWFHLGRQGDL